MIKNVDISTYYENQQLNDNTIKDAIASCLNIDVTSFTYFDSYTETSDDDYSQTGDILIYYQIVLYDIYSSCSTIESNLEECISSGKLTDLIQYYSVQNSASSLYNAISNSRDYDFYCRSYENNNNHHIPFASATQIALLWRGGYATYLNTTVSTNYNNASLVYKYFEYEDLKVVSEMVVTWDFEDEYRSGNISYDGYLSDYIYQYELTLANGTLMYGSNEYALFIFESSNVTDYENSFFGFAKGGYGGSWNNW